MHAIVSIDFEGFVELFESRGDAAVALELVE